MPDRFQNPIDVVEQSSSPSAPSSGYGRFYPKSDGKPYFKNSAGDEIDLSLYVPQTINEQTGTTYTLALTDYEGYVRCNNVSAITVTVPKNIVVAFPIGTAITIEQKGAGQITVSPVDGDVTINAYGGTKSAGQYAGVQLKKVDTNVWTLIGGVA